MAVVNDLRQWTQSRPKKTMDLYYRHQEQLLVSTRLHISILAQLKAWLQAAVWCRQDGGAAGTEHTAAAMLQCTWVCCRCWLLLLLLLLRA